MKLGTMEIILIIALVVLLFGGGKIAGLGKAVGTSIRDFKKEMREDKLDSESTVTPEDKAAKTSNMQSNENNSQE